MKNKQKRINPQFGTVALKDVDIHDPMLDKDARLKGYQVNVAGMSERQQQEYYQYMLNRGASTQNGEILGGGLDFNEIKLTRMRSEEGYGVTPLNGQTPEMARKGPLGDRVLGQDYQNGEGFDPYAEFVKRGSGRCSAEEGPDGKPIFSTVDQLYKAFMVPDDDGIFTNKYGKRVALGRGDLLDSSKITIGEGKLDKAKIEDCVPMLNGQPDFDLIEAGKNYYKQQNFGMADKIMDKSLSLVGAGSMTYSANKAAYDHICRIEKAAKKMVAKQEQQKGATQEQKQGAKALPGKPMADSGNTQKGRPPGLSNPNESGQQYNAAKQRQSQQNALQRRQDAERSSSARIGGQKN